MSESQIAAIRTAQRTELSRARHGGLEKRVAIPGVGLSDVLAGQVENFLIED
jgi:hypothetical protein